MEKIFRGLMKYRLSHQRNMVDQFKKVRYIHQQNITAQFFNVS